MFSHQMTTSYKMQLAALLASLRSSQRAGLTVNSVNVNVGREARASRSPPCRSPSPRCVATGGEAGTSPKEREEAKLAKDESQKRQRRGKGQAGANYPIESFDNVDRNAQVIEQHRLVLQTNVAANVAGQVQDWSSQRDRRQQAQMSSQTEQAQEPEVDAGDINGLLAGRQPACLAARCDATRRRAPARRAWASNRCLMARCS